MSEKYIVYKHGGQKGLADAIKFMEENDLIHHATIGHLSSFDEMLKVNGHANCKDFIMKEIKYLLFTVKNGKMSLVYLYEDMITRMILGKLPNLTRVSTAREFKEKVRELI